MNGLPSGYIARPATLDDIDDIATLVNQYTFRLIGELYLPAKHLRNYLTVPGFDLATSSKLVLSSTGSIAGFALVMDIRAPYVEIPSWGFVPEAEQGKGIGSALHGWIEPRARETIAKAPEGARVFVSQSLFDQEELGRMLLEQCGYQQTRHIWRMAVALDKAPTAPVWPLGIEPQNVDLRVDLEQPLRAANEACRDHYGYVEGDFEQRLERRRHEVENDPDYSPELSFLAMDNDQIAGFCFCSPQSGTDTSAGYVNSLAVLRPWRKRGLGLALLHHAFGVFKQKGKVSAALHVDAQSLTGATRLYEKAGMHVDQLSHEYQLELRAGVDLATK
ncbi:GNAT family N-acetyltransferase [bacterium]|nr:GNAT family N-acetyltransferase [bacterium]